MNNSESFMAGAKVAIAIKNRVILEAFISLCESALTVAVESHTFKNRTHNLENSFSYGIYRDGSLIEHKSIGSSDGSKEAEAFLNDYRPKHNWGAVIVAGAWYGTLLEKFKTSRGNSFVVLSDSLDFVSLEYVNSFKKHSING